MRAHPPEDPAFLRHIGQILAWGALACLIGPSALAAKKALVLSDGNFIPGPTAAMADSLRARGYAVDFSENNDKMSALYEIETFVKSVHPGDTAVINLGCHGGIPENALAAKTGKHFCCLSQDCSERLFIGDIRRELIDPLVAKGIHPVLMEEACGSGSSVLQFKNVPGACVIASTEATSVTYSATADFAKTLRNPKVTDFKALAVELGRSRVRSAQVEPARGSDDVWYSGCASDNAMQVRTDLLNDAAYLAHWNLATSDLYRVVYPESDRKSGGDLNQLLAGSCRKDEMLGESLEAWEHDLSTVVDEETWEEKFEAHSFRDRGDLLAGGILPGQESIRSWRDLKREIQASARRIRETRARLARTLASLDAEVHRPSPNGAEIARLRAEYRQLDEQVWNQMREFDTLFTWVREVQCTDAPSPCRNVAI